MQVRETLQFAARLRLPEDTSAAGRAARVQQVINLLGLQDCADSYVGDAMSRGISGGQAKRLSLAADMIALPALLCLDEPTTGMYIRICGSQSEGRVAGLTFRGSCCRCHADR